MSTMMEHGAKDSDRKPDREAKAEERSETNQELAKAGNYETEPSVTRLEELSNGEAEEHRDSERSAEERAEEVLRGGRLMG